MEMATSFIRLSISPPPFLKQLESTRGINVMPRRFMVFLWSWCASHIETKENQMIQFNAPNDPNPSRLIESLRCIGYSNYEALADLVDNCLDADATLIKIKVTQRGGDFHIILADDGIGMDHETLDQAHRLGSLTERDLSADLGKFGMGLVTASLSMSRRNHVITRKDGEFLTSIIDVDEVIRTNSFTKHLGSSGSEDKAIFAEVLGDAPSGTVVILSKTDKLQNRNVTQFSNVLRKTIGEIHRYFLFAGKKMFINDEAVSPIDPLQQTDPRTEVFSDELYPIDVELDGGKSTEQIRVKIVLVPEDAGAGELELARGLMNQGFYVMRNQRQIYRAQTLGFFTKHNDFNRMRGEIFFPGKLDDLVGIEFTKRQVLFCQAVQDRLAEHLVGQCRTIKRRMSSREILSSTGEQQEYHDQASKTITEKSRLLITPKAAIEKRSEGDGKRTNPDRTGKESIRERKNFKAIQRVKADLRCRFLHAQLGPGGQIYECDLEGRTVVIRWNIDHPFFRRFVIDNQTDGRLVTAIDFLVYSLACAELRSIDNESTELMNSVKAVISANLRTLLS
jgi:hypothetical protein